VLENAFVFNCNLIFWYSVVGRDVGDEVGTDVGGEVGTEVGDEVGRAVGGR